MAPDVKSKDVSQELSYSDDVFGRVNKKFAKSKVDRRVLRYRTAKAKVILHVLWLSPPSTVVQKH